MKKPRSEAEATAALERGQKLLAGATYGLELFVGIVDANGIEIGHERCRCVFAILEENGRTVIRNTRSISVIGGGIVAAYGLYVKSEGGRPWLTIRHAEPMELPDGHACSCYPGLCSIQFGRGAYFDEDFSLSITKELR